MPSVAIVALSDAPIREVPADGVAPHASLPLHLGALGHELCVALGHGGGQGVSLVVELVYGLGMAPAADSGGDLAMRMDHRLVVGAVTGLTRHAAREVHRAAPLFHHARVAAAFEIRRRGVAGETVAPGPGSGGRGNIPCDRRKGDRHARKHQDSQREGGQEQPLPPEVG